MNTLLRSAHLYDPEDRGVVDILVASGRVLAIGRDLSPSLPDLAEVECDGALLIPGLIDQHVHIIGGGGEDGPESRVPPLAFSDLAKAGVTTVVGTLGTDSHSKTLRDLFASAYALNRQGVTCHCLTGSYEYPSPTLTGSVADDIVFVAPVIGCKLAISDQRCSCPTTEEIIRLASEVRLGGLVGGKVGELHIHVGADERGIEQLFEAVEKSPIPITTYHPTHMGGHREQAEKWAKAGGFSDITAGEKAVEAILSLRASLSDAEWRNITMSSDSNGSFPRWNERKEIIGMGRGHMTTLLKTMEALVREGLSLPDALSLCTSHVADALHERDAGRVAVGKRADLVLLSRDMRASSVMAKGLWLSRDGVILKKGMYEES